MDVDHFTSKPFCEGYNYQTFLTCAETLEGYGKSPHSSDTYDTLTPNGCFLPVADRVIGTDEMFVMSESFGCWLFLVTIANKANKARC